MSKVQIHYFFTASRRAPVKEFVQSLCAKSQARFIRAVGLLKDHGFKLLQPHAKYLGYGVFELRLNGQEGAIRVLYFFHGYDKAVLTNGFIKKTNKTPIHELRVAIERKDTYLRSS